MKSLDRIEFNRMLCFQQNGSLYHSNTFLTSRVFLWLASRFRVPVSISLSEYSIHTSCLDIDGMRRIENQRLSMMSTAQRGNWLIQTNFQFEIPSEENSGDESYYTILYYTILSKFESDATTSPTSLLRKPRRRGRSSALWSWKRRVHLELSLTASSTTDAALDSICVVVEVDVL